HVERRTPLVAVNEVVPVGDDVVDRTAALAERDAAVHAACALRRCFFAGQRRDELAGVAHALGDRQRRLGDALALHEAGHLAHYIASLLTRRPPQGASKNSWLRCRPLASIRLGRIPTRCARGAPPPSLTPLPF